MKKHIYSHIAIILFCFAAFSGKATNNFSISGCSVAGTASLLQDSICYQDTTQLNLTGYVGAIQWQSFDGTAWNNETGLGALTDSYLVSPGITKQYRAVVTNTGCAADTSNIITITVGIIPVPTGVGTARCGPGQVTVTASGNGLLQWYDAATGGSIIGTGSPFSTYIPATTNLYVTDNSSNGSNSSPIMVSEAELDDFGGGDDLEIMNVAPYPVDVTGWKVAVSQGNTDANINSVNTVVKILSGILAPGQTITWNDLTTASNYWGSNFQWLGGGGGNNCGWVAIISSNDSLADFVAWDFSLAAVQSAVLSIDGINYTVGSQWSGTPINNTAALGGLSVSRQGNLDHNDATDFSIINTTIGTLNPGMTLPFLGLGCSSPRVPVSVFISSSEDVIISAVPPALCEGQSSILSVSSLNTNYTYTWSPATGLSSTTGASVTATPLSPISYIVIGDDGTCSNRDTVFINVGPVSQAGTASIVKDTICVTDTTTLSLAGSVGTIQWQSNTGSGWINETGVGSNSSAYVVNPGVNTQYQAVVTSGGCDADTSILLSLAVLTITEPLVTDTTVCANDTVTLTATGAGVIGWYKDSIGGYEINSGSTFTTFIIGDTTFYAAAKGGVNFHSGPADNAFGSSAQVLNADYGIGFNVARTCTLDKVYVYAVVAGNITLNLRSSQGGPILATVTQYVTPSINKTAIGLGWVVPPGNGYRLELAGTSVALKYNFSGAVYPYVNGNSPVTITGYLSPFFNTGTQYFYFYDWVLFEGCISSRAALHITTTPTQPIVTQNGTQLTSSASTGNQWYFNGNLLSGQTSQTLVISQVGLYSVSVTSGGCTASGSLNVTVIGIDQLQQAGIAVFPNPVGDKITIRFDNVVKNNMELRLTDAAGALVFERKQMSNVSTVDVDTKKIAPGTYLLEIKLSEGVYRKTLVKN